TTVRQILENPQGVITQLGNHGNQIVELAQGIDRRKVTPYAEVKSIGTEQTFQHDTLDFDHMRDVLLLDAEKLSYDIRLKGLYAHTITLKVTYHDMKTITRSKSGDATDKAATIYETAAELLGKIEKRAIRLIGITLSGFTDIPSLQMSLFDSGSDPKQEKLDKAMMDLRAKYGRGIIKTANVLQAEKRVLEDDEL
ncbi:MAG: DNA polymerase IV, partial [Oscillospiraceae bacterium]|nr:DNA polymerase IV [Oscillospiraceae bacterium]